MCLLFTDHTYIVCFNPENLSSQLLYIIIIILYICTYCISAGSTAVGWMAVKGNKAEGTDVHSKTASTIGITRDQAKVWSTVEPLYSRHMN